MVKTQRIIIERPAFRERRGRCVPVFQVEVGDLAVLSSPGCLALGKPINCSGPSDPVF